MLHRDPEYERHAGLIRQLRPSDLQRFQEHLLRLDPAGRRDRFNGGMDDAFLASYADRSFHGGATVVGYVEDDRILGAAELHERSEFDIPTGEIAFSVEHDRQGRGIGSRLFERLLLHARALGYARLLVTTHADNEAMKRLARKFEADLSFEAGDATGVIALGGPPGRFGWTPEAATPRTPAA